MLTINRDEYMTAAEVAKLWGVTPEAVRRQVRRGQLRAVVPPSGVGILIHRDDAALRVIGGPR